MSTPELPLSAGQEENFGASTGEILSPDDEALIELIADFYHTHPNTILADTANEYSDGVYELSKQLHGWSGAGDDEDSFMAVYSAVNFALFVENVRHGTKTSLPELTHLTGYYQMDERDTASVVQERAAEYFRKHPSDRGIVLAFMSDLDPHNDHTESVEGVYGFVLDAIENERELFEALGRDVYQDITSVCGKIARAQEELLASTIDEFMVKRRRQPDLSDEYDVNVVRASMTSWFLERWPKIEHAPKAGDTIVVNGRGIVIAEVDDEEGERSWVCLPFSDKKQQVRGTFTRFVIDKYLDHAWLDLGSDEQSEPGDAYLRRFGIHFVLEKAVLINDMTSMAVDTLYVPLHYPEMEVRLIRTAVASDKA